MPSAPGQNNLIMESQKIVSTVSSTQLDEESSIFICTECGDGFSQYSNVLTHMASHGPLESFSFDGSSNGFDIPREYVLQENGTLTVLNGLSQSHSSIKPMSPGVLPPPPPSKPLSPTLRPQLPPLRDLLKPSDLNLDKPHKAHHRCEICSRSFKSLQSLHRHQQYRNTERGYKCTLCCKIFEGREDLTKHLEDHANESFHCCSHCGKRFLKVDALKSHQKENHISPKTVVGKSDNKHDKKYEKIYSCRKCKLIFFWMSDFQTHCMFHCRGIEPDSPFVPEIECNSKHIEDVSVENCYSNGTSFDVKHGDTKIIKDMDIDTELSSTPYRCGLCGDRFQRLAALKEHHLTHQTQEEIDQLNQETQVTFRRIQPKGRRRRSNPNGKIHPCKHCHRVFNHSSSLSRHMRYHKGTMHTCVFCGRHFPQRCDLRRHLAMYHKAELDKKPALKHLLANPQTGPALKSLNSNKNTFSPDEKTNCSSHIEKALSPEDGNPTDKQSEKVGRVNYKCQDCGKRFGLLSVYQRHLRYHKKEPSKYSIKNLSSQELHLQNQPGTGEASDVQMCEGTGTSEGTAPEKDLAEDKGNSSKVLYECTECTETFTCLEKFLQHQTSHGSENNG